MRPTALTVHDVSYEQLAGTIDHSLLKPQLTLGDVAAGCEIAARYEVVSVCVRPADVAFAAKELAGTSVSVGTMISFPHGDSTTANKARDRGLRMAAVTSVQESRGGPALHSSSRSCPTW